MKIEIQATLRKLYHVVRTVSVPEAEIYEVELANEGISSVLLSSKNEYHKNYEGSATDSIAYPLNMAILDP